MRKQSNLNNELLTALSSLLDNDKAEDKLRRDILTAFSKVDQSVLKVVLCLSDSDYERLKT